MDHIRKEMIVILALPHCDFKTPPPAVKMVLEVVKHKDKTITYAITIIIFVLFIFVKIISYGFVTVAHRCHGKRNNLAAKEITSRHKEKDSRRKEKAHGKKKKPNGQRKNLPAPALSFMP